MPAGRLVFASGSAGKESACNVGDLGSIPGLGRSPGEGNGYPLQCSGPCIACLSQTAILCCSPFRTALGVTNSQMTERLSLSTSQENVPGPSSKESTTPATQTETVPTLNSRFSPADFGSGPPLPNIHPLLYKITRLFFVRPASGLCAACLSHVAILCYSPANSFLPVR